MSDVDKLHHNFDNMGLGVEGRKRSLTETGEDFDIPQPCKRPRISRHPDSTGFSAEIPWIQFSGFTNMWESGFVEVYQFGPLNIFFENNKDAVDLECSICRVSVTKPSDLDDATEEGIAIHFSSDDKAQCCRRLFHIACFLEWNKARGSKGTPCPWCRGVVRTASRIVIVSDSDDDDESEDDNDEIIDDESEDDIEYVRRFGLTRTQYDEFFEEIEAHLTEGELDELSDEMEWDLEDIQAREESDEFNHTQDDTRARDEVLAQYFRDWEDTHGQTLGGWEDAYARPVSKHEDSEYFGDDEMDEQESSRQIEAFFDQAKSAPGGVDEDAFYAMLESQQDYPHNRERSESEHEDIKYFGDDELDAGERTQQRQIEAFFAQEDVASKDEDAFYAMLEGQQDYPHNRKRSDPEHRDAEYCADDGMEEEERNRQIEAFFAQEDVASKDEDAFYAMLESQQDYPHNREEVL